MYQAQWHAMRSFTRDKSVTQQRLSRGIVRRIASYARPYRLDLVIFLTLTALSAVIAVAVPLLLRRIIDKGILPGDTSVVLWVAGVVAALAVVGAALSVATRWFSARIGRGSSTTCAPRCTSTCSGSRWRSSPGPRPVRW